MRQIKKIAFLNGLGIVGIIGGDTALIVMHIFSAWTFILAVIVCYPLVRDLWHCVIYLAFNPVSLLHKNLPKIGFNIEDTEWDDKHSNVRFIGNFRGYNFLIKASYDNAFIGVFEEPWCLVRSSDPNIPDILEAINEVNASKGYMCVYMEEPNEDNVRRIYTMVQSIIPTIKSDNYISSLFCEMLDCKQVFAEAMKKERPYMIQ